MPKGQEIYDRAIALLNERDANGSYHIDAGDFTTNAVALINILAFRLKYDQCIVTGTTVNENNWANLSIKTLNDNLSLDVKLAMGVLPYGLAALLIMEEDGERSKYFYSLFKEAEEQLLFFHKRGKRHPVSNVY